MVEVNTFIGKRIILYGSGDIAKRFINDNPGVVVGILDRFEMYGTLEGISYTTWEELGVIDADGVVIAARQCFCEEIYNRILPLCMARNLPIYDVSGNNLNKYFGRGFKRSGNYLSFERIKDIALNYDVISFDVFDTLLDRTVFYPIDLFDLVSIRLREKGISLSDFKKIRRHCELISKGPKLEDIYKEIEIFMRWTHEETVDVMNEEIACELENVVPRQIMVELLNWLKAIGKTIFITSDMYLPSDIIGRMLEIAGVSGYDEIFVSCEFNKGKGDTLYEIIRDKLEGKKCLHIGDNYYLDVVMPRRFGIDSVGIEAVRDSFQNSAIGYSFAFSRTVSDKYYLGYLANSIFEKNRELIISDAAKLANVFCTPFAVLYIQLILKYLKQGRYDGVLFPARDGYILEEIYRQVASRYGISVPAYYIPSSRKLMIKTGVINNEELEYSRKYLNIVKKPIESLFGVLGCDDEEADAYELALNYRDKIYENVFRSRKNYIGLLNKYGIDINKKYLLCEFNGQGTTQHYLSRLFVQELDTVYMSHFAGVEKLKANAVYMLDNMQKQYSSLCQRFDILEFVFSSDQPSVVDIGDSGEWIFDADNRNRHSIALMKKMQGATIEAAVDILTRFDVFNYPLSAEVAEHILDGYGDVELEGECKILDKDVYYDDLMKTYVR